MPPKSYKVPTENLCKDCKLVHIKTDWEADPEYYCTLGAPARPADGGRDENFLNYIPKRTKNTEKAFRTISNKWDTWAKNRKVCPYGTCDNFKNMTQL